MRASYPRSPRILVVILIALHSLSSSLAQTPDSDPPWGEVVDGLQFRLRAEQTVWPFWKRPIVIVDIRNRSDTLIKAKDLADRLFVRGRGPTVLQKKLESFPQTGPYTWNVDIEFDQDLIGDLEVEQSLSIPLTISGLQQSRESASENALQPDQFDVAIGTMLPRQEQRLYTPALQITVLVPGTETMKELETYLTTYQINGQQIAAGFVPGAPTFIDGQDATLTFVVHNRSEKPFSFSFGGDYRGAARHNRFKIEIRNRQGELLKDPASQFGDFGGILWPRVVLSGRMTTERLDLSKYRTIPGPGEYELKASFELSDEFAFGAAGKVWGPQQVESKLKLKILPRTPDNVAQVLDRLFKRCDQTSGQPLADTIREISQFGKVDAVEGLAQLTRNRSLPLRHAAIGGLALIDDSSALDVLLAIEPDPEVRVQALRALGSFGDERAAKRAIAALDDRDDDARAAAIAALGQMSMDVATVALLNRFQDVDTPKESSWILAALGASKSDNAFDVIAESLANENPTVRRAAVDAIIQFNPGKASSELGKYVTDEDLEFREYAIRNLAEKLRQPIEAEWLVPVIQSRKGGRTIGDAPRLMRLYTDAKAAPALLSALDLGNPSIRNYYNMVIVQNQLACRTGLAIPWIGDLNRDATAEELEHNRQILTRIASWLDEYKRQPWTDPPEPWRLPPDQERETWGTVVDGVRLRARTNTSVWPHGLPQVLIIDLTKFGSSILFDQQPNVLEIEVNGEWYAHDPAVEMKVSGDWQAYKGHRYHSFQLGNSWKRIADGQALTLPPGEYTARVRVTPPGSDQRSKMVTSKAVTFRVVGNKD